MAGRTLHELVGGYAGLGVSSFCICAGVLTGVSTWVSSGTLNSQAGPGSIKG